MLFDLLFVAILRLRRVRKILLSHHSFAYIDRPSWLMRAIEAVARPSATHLFLCERMRAGFSARYGRNSSGLVLSNARRVAKARAPISAPMPTEFTLGYLSNLSFEKGISEFFDLIDILTKKGLSFGATIAGPASSDEVAEFVQARLDACGGRVRWLGPVYGAQKEEFLSQLSVLVFPTKYVNEAQPNVLFEALSHGVPVVSIARGCVDEDMNGCLSHVARSPESFLEEAVPHIMWLADRTRAGEGEEIRSAVARSFMEKHSSSVAAEQKLLELILSDPKQ
ncbi:glycosyltransferase family 4 protein [Bradyrhizobium genosp. SA-3]|uniref:glycosyltransferase family 4 protein n=1 Tax=Bradyrhizobium genosp. SA-3 TaxID=508868 RepID=UPI0013EE6606|nr:glycosyltransferase family 4 protein [Bradyrhizobium genosp. SA-3]